MLETDPLPQPGDTKKAKKRKTESNKKQKDKRKMFEEGLTFEERTKKVELTILKKNLLGNAYKANIFEELADTSALNQPSLQLTKTLQNLHGCTIEKKATRRNRILLCLPGHIKFKQICTEAKDIGKLKMDSTSPTLYLNFTEGVLKLLGMVVYTKNNFISFQATRSKELLCQDSFQKLVVFSQAVWIGDQANNPEEQSLPLPLNFKEKYVEGSSKHVEGKSHDRVKRFKGDVKREERRSSSSPEHTESVSEESVDENISSLKSRLQRKKASRPYKPLTEYLWNS
ncbi:uncharacterized protein LOC135145876 isoform X2 [Zophobas morio]|jgi:hypothetical protein|uniref:uncharacterized protein LOC135145876 isoform X2 n=1 Tax=Zophobas morio TaxID=2755281 RepID=UPI003082F1E3